MQRHDRPQLFSKLGPALKKLNELMMKESKKRLLENTKINERIDRLKDLERKPEESNRECAFKVK